MRLLNTSTLQVEDFLEREVPEYAILSHTWQEDEVTFQDIQSAEVVDKKGYVKIRKCCDRAIADGYSYCWVDTCCIDKTSSAELSEAINSMYQYYKNSCICYAYLEDVKEPRATGVLENWRRRNTFTKSRWWKRGWTLQELIAPGIVEFYNANWEVLGTKLSLCDKITEITSIDEQILRGADSPLRRNVAVRMSWAAERETSRTEDKAYCLMGLFGVHMPLLYGEGNRAFIRLQEEIMRVREDNTIFAWGAGKDSPLNPAISRGLLASAPSDFVDSRTRTFGLYLGLTLFADDRSTWGFRELLRSPGALFEEPESHELPQMTSRGLRISLPILEQHTDEALTDETFVCISLLRRPGDEAKLLCITLQRLSTKYERSLPRYERFVRHADADLTLLDKTSSVLFQYKTIYIVQPSAFSVTPDRLLAPPALSGSLVLVKIVGFEDTIQCYLSSWISLDDVFAARSAQKHPSTTSPGSTTGPQSKPSDEANAVIPKYRMKKLVSVLSTLNDDDLHSLAMDHSPAQCWFTEVDRNRINKFGDRGVLGFASNVSANRAFLVQLRLFENRPMCNVVHTTLDGLRDNTERMTVIQDAQKTTFYSDCVHVPIGNDLDRVIRKGTRMLGMTVSIRRLVSAPSGLRRFLLSITRRSDRINFYQDARST